MRQARGDTPAELLAELLFEVELLDDSPEISNTLLVLPDMSFDDYLDLLGAAEELVPEAYQVASFHPDYVFKGVDPSDPANSTNRAPHPVLHILRQSEVAAAIATHPDIESVPVRNAALFRSR